MAAEGKTIQVGDRDVCIVGIARTPIGSYGGSLASVPATELGATAIRGALAAAGVDAAEVQETFFGNVMSANLGQNPARQCAIAAGIPNTSPATTVNKVCSSGLKATSFAAGAIMLGLRDVVVSGGTESMSRVPHYMDQLRFGCRFGHQEMVDGVIKDGLWDAYSDQHMGSCAELCATKHSFDREAQDLFAAESYRRAVAAASSGAFASEIVPVAVKQRRGPPKMVTADEEPVKNAGSALVADTTASSAGDESKSAPAVPASLSKLRPAFKRDGGTVTAGNASTLSDGAAALVLVSGAYAAAHGLSVLAVVRGFDDAAQAPEEFTTAPALAVPKAMARAGVTADQVDLFELNEAFAVVGLANTKLLGLDVAKVNVNGGAVALGHPLGCSGARILVTLIAALRARGKRFGVAGICNGGGGASAMVVEAVASSKL